MIDGIKFKIWKAIVLETEQVKPAQIARRTYTVRNVVLCLIISFGILSCNENKNKPIYNSDNSQYLSPLVEDTVLYTKTLSQEKREELITFCDLFISALQSNNIEKIKDVIDFPIWVECLKER